MISVNDGKAVYGAKKLFKIKLKMKIKCIPTWEYSSGFLCKKKPFNVGGSVTFRVAFCEYHHSSLIIHYVLDVCWDLEGSLWKLTKLIHDKEFEKSHILGRLFYIFCLGWAHL